MLDLQAVRQLLPDPSHPLPAKDPFREGGLRRTLLGLGLWAEEHLA